MRESPPVFALEISNLSDTNLSYPHRKIKLTKVLNEITTKGSSRIHFKNDVEG